MVLFHLLQRIIYVFLWGKKNIYLISDEKKLVYIVVPKTGCSSIKQSICGYGKNGVHPVATEHIKTIVVHRLTTKQKKYSIFTFVRNPFDRIVSCYVHKIVRSKTSLRKKYGWYAIIENEETFSSFVEKVSMIPDVWSDQHFQSQYSILHRFGKPRYKTLGHFETLEKDFEPIQNMYQLLPLTHIHNTKKGDWRDYYTTPIAKKVYHRYKQDIHAFGYEDAYHDLLSYLKEKGV